MTLNFEPFSLPAIIFIFACAAGVVWFAGSRLSRYADALARKTGTADVLIGTLLLGGVTSLPEVVTTVSASAGGDAEIAINNLFGGVALQVTILAIGDLMVRKRSITSLIESPVIQLQAVICILLLVTAACIVLVGDIGIAHIGVGSLLILFIFVTAFSIVNYFNSIHWWSSEPEGRDGISEVRKIMAETNVEEEEVARENEPAASVSFVSMGNTRLTAYLILTGLAILVAGYTVVQTGQAIASKTGIGSSIVGAIFIALATSLPEVSTTISSVKIKRYRLAFSNVLGTNIFTIGFVFLADIFYTEGPVLNDVGQFSIFGALLGILLTTFYMIGLSLRLKKTFLRLGYDSIAVVIGYLVGVSIMLTAFKT